MDFPAYYTISKEDWDAVHEQYVDADRTDWGISASTEEKVGENAGKYGIATCILDGDLASFWHSQWKGEGANPPLPHEIIIDMQGRHLDYYPHPAGNLHRKCTPETEKTYRRQPSACNGYVLLPQGAE